MLTYTAKRPMLPRAKKLDTLARKARGMSSVVKG